MNREFQVLYLELADGSSPFKDWIERVDRSVRPIIFRRVMRLRLGMFGDWKSIGRGVLELRIDFGPGYRIYFGNLDRSIVILLLGGNKRSQKRDIEAAKKLWQEFTNENKKFTKRTI